MSNTCKLPIKARMHVCASPLECEARMHVCAHCPLGCTQHNLPVCMPEVRASSPSYLLVGMGDCVFSRLHKVLGVSSRRTLRWIARKGLYLAKAPEKRSMAGLKREGDWAWADHTALSRPVTDTQTHSTVAGLTPRHQDISWKENVYQRTSVATHPPTNSQLTWTTHRLSPLLLNAPRTLLTSLLDEHRSVHTEQAAPRASPSQDPFLPRAPFLPRNPISFQGPSSSSRAFLPFQSTG